MQNLGLLTPELTLSGLALAVMLADMVLPRSKSRWLYHLAWLSSAAVLVLIVASLGDPAARGTVRGSDAALDVRPHVPGLGDRPASALRRDRARLDLVLRAGRLRARQP